MYAWFFYWYQRGLLKLLRGLIFVVLIVLCLLELTNGSFPKIPLILLMLFSIFEIFFFGKISRAKPLLTVSQNNTVDIYKSFTLECLSLVVTHSTVLAIIKSIAHTPQGRFLLNKATISQDTLSLDIPKQEFLINLFAFVKQVKGTFVTTMDFLIYYLLTTEPQTKLLFSKELKQEDVLSMLQLTFRVFQNEEDKKPIRVHYNGDGIGEGVVNGWTPETRKYTINYTNQACYEKPKFVGREKEFGQLLEGISKQKDNNVLFVGEPGVGKDAIVKFFAYQSSMGNLGELNSKKVLELLVGQLISGVSTKGELEERLEGIINEVSHSLNVVLYIPDFENMLGSSSFAIDVSQSLLPYAQNGAMPILASMTPENFKQYMEKNPLREVFETIHIGEPDEKTVLVMLFQKSMQIEKQNNVSISFKGLQKSLELAKKYVPDSFLPGAAVKLLQDSSHSVSVARKPVVLAQDIIQKIESTVHVPVGIPTSEEKNLLLHLEDALHTRVIGQDAAVSAISEALRRIRSGVSLQTKPISFLFLGPTGVGKTEVAKTVASIYFGGEGNIIRLDMSEYSSQDGLRRLLGATAREGNERGELTEKIHDHPFSLVLLDEFEKAHSSILDLFLQVLEDGRLTDNKGKTVSFLDAIIIATSNAGSEFIREEVSKGVTVDKQFQYQLLEFLQKQNIFRPELLNRFDDVITFKPLTKEESAKIVGLLLHKVSKKLLAQDITVTLDALVVTKIVKEGFDKEFGARPLRRYIQDTIEEVLSQKILKDEIKRGNKVVFSVDQNNAISCSVTS